jgi:hypothetical protein
MNIYISIGAQCTTPTLFDRLGVKKESLPFDWMFSTPEFVYTILRLLLIEKKEIDDIIDNYFFLCDKRAILQGVEHHVLNETGAVLVNSKYNVCFPHDTLPDRDKYIRRMERLKQIILDTNNFIHFVYVAVSSPTNGNYTLNGVAPIKDLYEYINKLNSILLTVRTKYKISIFDTNKSSDIKSSDSIHVANYDIGMRMHWHDLLPELIDKCNNLIDTKIWNK